MIRNLLIAIFFFIGPAMLMFIARNLVLIGLLWLKKRHKRELEHKVIDITPIHNHRHPNWYVIIVVIVSLICAVTVFMELQKDVDVEPQQYVPAYTDDSGRVVPGHWQPIQPENQQTK
jgi:hypothetical protein